MSQENTGAGGVAMSHREQLNLQSLQPRPKREAKTRENITAPSCFLHAMGHGGETAVPRVCHGGRSPIERLTRKGCSSISLAVIKKEKKITLTKTSLGEKGVTVTHHSSLQPRSGGAHL